MGHNPYSIQMIEIDKNYFLLKKSLSSPILMLSTNVDKDKIEKKFMLS